MLAAASLAFGLVPDPSRAFAHPAGPSKPTLAFKATLAYTKEAARRLEKSGEGVVVDAYWYGAPTPAHRRDADQIGQIVVDRFRRVLSPRTRDVLIAARDERSRRIEWLVNRRVLVNVNVYSARRTSPDNLLDCTFFDDTVALAREGVHLRCGLLPPPETRVVKKP